jgi:hypothetical protein
MLINISEELPASITKALMMEAVSSFETSVSIYQATWRNIPEDSHLNFDIGIVWFILSVPLLKALN